MNFSFWLFNEDIDAKLLSLLLASSVLIVENDFVFARSSFIEGKDFIDSCFFNS
jgi:hypothetical protein